MAYDEEVTEKVTLADPRKEHHCSFKYRGCKRKFLELHKKEIHEKECQKRKYQCEGKLFCGWNCDWAGYFEDIPLHFKEKHRERTYMKHRSTISTELHMDADSYDIQLIAMRKKLFWYKHKTSVGDKMGYWVCQYIGEQEQAQTYGYDFLVVDGLRQFYISELCHTDASDANKLFQDGLCVNISASQVKSFLRGKKKLEIQFKIKKRKTLGRRLD